MCSVLLGRRGWGGVGWGAGGVGWGGGGGGGVVWAGWGAGGVGGRGGNLTNQLNTMPGDH